MKFKKGQILLVRYKKDPVGKAIRRITHCRYNHVCWIIDNEHILEVRNKATEIKHISCYFDKKKYEFVVLELNNISTYKLNKVIKYALSLQGRMYYHKWLISLVMVWANYQGKFPQYTCSGFVAKCLAQVEWFFMDKNPNLITPADIYNSKYTKELKC